MVAEKLLFIDYRCIGKFFEEKNFLIGYAVIFYLLKYFSHEVPKIKDRALLMIIPWSLIPRSDALTIVKYEI